MAAAVIAKSQSTKSKGEVWKYRFNIGTYTISIIQVIDKANAQSRFALENKYLPKALPVVLLDNRLAY